MNTNGRVVLKRDVLIKLRREKGLSQALMATQCAEQQLRVSIASIKRAETGKNILYRTARDIAQFFAVDIGDLIQIDISNDKVNPSNHSTE